MWFIQEFCGKQWMKWFGTEDELKFFLYCFEVKVGKLGVFSISSWHQRHNECTRATFQFTRNHFHIEVLCYEQISLGFSCPGSGGWEGPHRSSGAPGKEEERAASCLTVCWTDYSLIAVDVKADEVITWPVWCGRARPCDKVNPPCVCSSGCCL